jgi:serine/threonine-protein kinase
MASRWIWPFELLDKLGEGGMGIVYRARYVGNDRIVAVKILPTDVAENESIIARFDRELEILKQLKHPNIVNCFGGVCESKQRFYAMELVDGGTLAELLRQRKRFSWDHVVEFGLQMCAALQHAHERGVIHRDIKPGNFLITKSGQLKLSDFGLATMASASRITRAGKTAGTFLYMAPEQIRGQPPVSPRTDLYALGCVFFELLTGRPPFDGETPAMILQKHLKEPAPRVSSLLPECPPAVDQLVADLLQKSPEDRPESAQEVETRLRAVLRPSIVHIDPFARTPFAAVDVIPSPAKVESESSVAAIPIRRIPTAPWLALVGALLILGSFGWWRAAAVSGRLTQLEAAMVESLRHGSTPTRLLTLTQLGRVEELGSAATQAVGEMISDPDPQIRLAALRLIERRPAAGRGRVAEIAQMQKRDESPEVRQQAQFTAEAIRRAPAEKNWGGWMLFLAGAVVFGGLGWWAWKQRFWERGVHG